MKETHVLDRLRSWDRCYPGNHNIERMVDDAAARIESLEAENAALRDALAKENFRVLALERSLMAASIFSQQTEGEG